MQLFEADSVEALYALADQHNDADLVLMDLNMPGAQGFNALVHMRSLHPSCQWWWCPRAKKPR